MSNRNPILSHILSVARDAEAGGFDVLSTGEKLAAAFVLNRADWLAEMDYTIPQAITRLGPDWVRLIPTAAELMESER